MYDPNIILNCLSKHSEAPDRKIRSLYKNFLNVNFYLKAYSNIYKKYNSLTEEPSELVKDKIYNLIEKLKTESYQPAPVKLLNIDGKTQSSNVICFEDKLIQEVCRLILEAIYEPRFLKSSHAFRNEKNCHSSLKEISIIFTSVNWFIKGDINNMLDNINRSKLIEILQENINDIKFINLIRKFIKAGHIYELKQKETYSNSSVGSKLSQTISNIYFNKLDTYIENELKNEFDCGIKKKKANNRYDYLAHKIMKLNKKLLVEPVGLERENIKTSIKEMKKEKNSIDAHIPTTNHKKLVYTRYANTFLLGVYGNKEDCIFIKEKIDKYLLEFLKLKNYRTNITNSLETIMYLGYEISVTENQKFFKNSNGIKARSGFRNIQLKMPHDVVIHYINKYKMVKDLNKEPWNMLHRKELLSYTELEIVTIYNELLKGLYNYYCMAENVAIQMNMLYNVCFYSCLKTLAGKHKCGLKKIFDKYRSGKDLVIPYVENNEKKYLYFFNKGFRKIPFSFKRYFSDEIPTFYKYSRKKI